MSSKNNLTDLTGDYKIKSLDSNEIYDVLIIGGGPAGLTSAVYCMRKELKTGLITLNIGGQVMETYGIENYMGYRYIEGSGLVEKFKEQIKQFEIGFKEGTKVKSIVPDKIKKVYTDDGNCYQAKALIIASGKSPRKLNVAGEKELTGRGVAYSLTMEGPLFAGENVAIIGGGNSGVEACIDLSRICKNITLVQGRDKLTADRILVDKVYKLNNVKVLCNYEVLKISGDNRVECITLRDKNSKEEICIDVRGVFVQVGLVPNTDFVKGVLNLNKFDEIEIDYACCTSVPGIFSAGDVTTVPFKQIIIAAGEGAKAGLSACNYILHNIS